MKVSRRWASLSVLGLLGLVVLAGLAGCEEEVVLDPYQYTSLRAIMTGAVMDTTHTFYENDAGEKIEYGQFAFEIDAPPFVYVQGPVGLIRGSGPDSNQIYFFVADDLENLYPSIDDAEGVLLGVKQAFTPAPTHLVLERIKRDGAVVQDSMPRPRGYVLPTLLRAGLVDISLPGKDLSEVRYNRYDETLAPLMPENETDPPLEFQTGIDSLVYVPRYDLPDSVKANPTDEDMAYYAVFPEGAFEIVELAPGADYMLDLLLAKELPVSGSVSPVAVFEDYTIRREEYDHIGHVVGELRLNWFRYANTFVQGYKAGF